MKIQIRFLRQGLIEAETPENYEQMSDLEKLRWGDEVINNLPDKEFIQAMADFTETDLPENFFDDTPALCSAIESTRGEILVETEEWRAFYEGRKIQ